MSKKQFTFSGLTFEIIASEQRGDRQEFRVKQVGSYEKAAIGEWNHSLKIWTKQPGNARFNNAITEAAGLK